MTSLPGVRDVSEEARQRGAEQATAAAEAAQTEATEQAERDPNRLVTIKVLRPFVFTRPARGGLSASQEQQFHHRGGPHANGEYTFDLDDANDRAFLDHPWIKALADGKIESPAQRKVRLDELAAKAAAIEAERATANAAASARTVSAETRVDKGLTAGDAAEMERNLNTPLNELRAGQGRDVHVPLSELRAKQGTGPMPAPPKTPAAPPPAPRVAETRDVSAEVRARGAGGKKSA